MSSRKYRWFRSGEGRLLFNYIEERSRNDPDHPCESKTLPDAGERVNTYLERTAIKWRKLGDEEILLGFSSVITEEQAGKLLSYWYKNVCLRKLWLFGLTNKDIRNCKMDLEKIYQARPNNPLASYTHYPKRKCIEILARQNKKPSPEEDYCSDIARKIYDRYENCSWIGVPSKNIIAEFPDAPKFRDRLCKDYGICDGSFDRHDLSSLPAQGRAEDPSNGGGDEEERLPGSSGRDSLIPN